MVTAVIRGAPSSGAVIRVHVCFRRRTPVPHSIQEPGTAPPPTAVIPKSGAPRDLLVTELS